LRVLVEIFEAYIVENPGGRNYGSPIILAETNRSFALEYMLQNFHW
jgi:hypothetical protein